jgi:hypothetical protein
MTKASAGACWSNAPFPATSSGGRPFCQDLVLLPLNLLQQSWQAIDSPAHALRERSATQWASFTVLIFALLSVGAWTRAWLRRAIRNAGARQPSFSTDLLLVAFQLLRDNLSTLLVLGLLAITLWQLQIPDRARGIAALWHSYGVGSSWPIIWPGFYRTRPASQRPSGSRPFTASSAQSCWSVACSPR